MNSTLAVFRAVALGRLREQPLRLVVTVLAVALGVALATAVQAINAGALGEFGLAARKLVGEADVVVRGPRGGFDEGLFVRLAGEASVEEASPALELDVAIETTETEESRAFNDILKKEGARAAIAWRDRQLD